MGKVCVACGLKNLSNTSNCAHCGAVLETNMSQTVNCGFCGKPNPLAVEVCEVCGAYLLKIPADSSQSKKGVSRKRRAAKSTTSLKEILPPSVEIRVLPPVNRVRFPILPPQPPPPVKKPIGRHVKSVLKSIVYGCIYVGFFAFVGWLLILFLSIFL